jgi:hypothetical protein
MHTPASALRFLTTLTAAMAASTASGRAAPAREETSARVRYGDARAQPPAGPPPADGWIELASPTPASHGREFITVDPSTGTLAALRLTATSGRPYIYKVEVDCKDHGRQVFEVDKRLDPRRPSLSLDLHGAREIEQIVVTTERTSPGSYVVSASATSNGSR